MTAAAILSSAAERGVLLSALSGRLRVESPRGPVPSDLVAALRENREEVLALLEGRAVEPTPGEVLPVVDRVPFARPEPVVDQAPPAQEVDQVPPEQPEPVVDQAALDGGADQGFEAQVARLVAAFSDQANRPGPVPFFTLPGAPPTPGGCLSCGSPLAEAYPPRCPACIEAAHRVLAPLAQGGAQEAAGAPPPPRPSCCPACGGGGPWRRVMGPDEAFCCRCGTVCDPPGPGPPPPRANLHPPAHEEEAHRVHPRRLPGPGVPPRRKLRVLAQR